MDRKGNYYNYMEVYDVTINKSSNYDYAIRGRNTHLDKKEYTRIRNNPKYWNN